MAKKWPTWPQLGSQDGAQIDDKWGRKSIESLLPSGINFQIDFVWIFGGKIEASCHQDRSNIDLHFGMRCFEKTLFFFMKNRTFEGPGGQKTCLLFSHHGKVILAKSPPH